MPFLASKITTIRALRDSNTYVLCSSMEKLWLSKVLQALVIVSLTLTRHLTGQFGILE